MEEVAQNYVENDGVLCPITLRTFRDPVIAADGYTYEREAIVRWITEHGTSPFTRQPLDVNELQADDYLRNLAARRKSSSVFCHVYNDQVTIQHIQETPNNNVGQMADAENRNVLPAVYRYRYWILLATLLLGGLLIGVFIFTGLRLSSSVSPFQYVTTTPMIVAVSTIIEAGSFWWNPNGVTVAGGNGAGSAANQLDYPIAIAASPSGDVYVADSYSNRIQFWSVDSTQGVTVWPLNGLGSGLDQLDFAVSLFLDSTGKQLYILDLNQRVLKWIIGTSAGTVVAGGNGVGSALNQLSVGFGGGGLTVDRLSNVYVSDYINCRVVKWPPGAASGQVVAGGNGYGNEANQLAYPMNIAIDAQFNIFVVDWENGRIQLWLPGASSGTTIASTVSWSSPLAVTLDSSDNIYIGDIGKIVMWSSTTQTATTIASGDGSLSNQVSMVYALSMTPDGSNLFAADTNNNRVQRYSLMNNF